MGSKGFRMKTCSKTWLQDLGSRVQRVWDGERVKIVVLGFGSKGARDNSVFETVQDLG